MTSDEFRRIALSLPEAVESAHFDHPDFRVGKKVFATLGYPDEAWAMIKLDPQAQAALVSAKPGMFVPVKGGWGRSGATNVRLAVADPQSVRAALTDAWYRTAPARLHASLQRD